MVKVLVLRTAGTNCDMETAFAFDCVGASVDLMHINRLASQEIDIMDYHILAIPGGFTYGDDIASGKILANELIHKINGPLYEFVNNARLIIGICNGFQVLVKAGLLPNIYTGFYIEASLSLNTSGKFEDRWTYLKPVKKNNCIWTKGIKGSIYLPVAHGEGKFIPKDKDIQKRLWENNQVVLQYIDAEGNLGGFPWNPNGSVDNIAGICDPTGRIFGLMPHPERHFLGQQHPRWTREGLKRQGDGARIFENGVRYAKNNL